MLSFDVHIYCIENLNAGLGWFVDFLSQIFRLHLKCKYLYVHLGLLNFRRILWTLLCFPDVEFPEYITNAKILCWLVGMWLSFVHDNYFVLVKDKT